MKQDKLIEYMRELKERSARALKEAEDSYESRNKNILLGMSLGFQASLETFKDRFNVKDIFVEE